MRYPDARILVFAKAPEAGMVKTRLIPALDAERAAHLYSRILVSTVQMVTSSALAPVQCWCAPDTGHEVFGRLARDYGVTLETQQGPDLGARMEQAASRVLKQVDSTVVIGGDCPVLQSAHLQSALAWLDEGNDAVLGPAEDGGYVLLGLTRSSPELFRDVQWGGEQVLALTRRRLSQLGWSWQELEPLWDLDRPEDLDRFMRLESMAGVGRSGF